MPGALSVYPRVTTFFHITTQEKKQQEKAGVYANQSAIILVTKEIPSVQWRHICRLNKSQAPPPDCLPSLSC